MSRQFSWHTEDTAGWSEDEAAGLPPEVTLTGRRWRWLVVVVVVLLGAAWMHLRRVERRVELEKKTISNDIASSFDLLAQAVVERDSELFSMMISSRDARWMAVQQSLLADGLLFDRQPMGIVAQTDVPQLVAVVPAPDLTEAEITVAGRYTISGMRPVTLQQTLVFRRGRQRWLLSPPGSEFWGAWETVEGRFLTMVFRQRDDAVARRLLNDLDAHLAAMCTNLADINCPADLKLQMRLESDPAVLADLSGRPIGLADRRRLDLPTPSLVGLPVDEAGYQLLRQSYALPVVVAAITKVVGWRCCEGGLFYQALVDYQLNKLGLRSWPLTAAEYETMFSNPIVNMRRLGRYWPVPPGSSEGWRQVYSVIAYVLDSDPTLSAAAMQQELAEANGYWRWMRRYVPDMFSVSTQQNWINYAQSYLAPADVPLPGQDIMLLCDAGAGESSTLYRYDLSAERWRPEVEERPFLFMSPMSGGDGVLLQERMGEIGQTQATIWDGENESRLFARPMTSGLFRVDIAGEKMLLYAYDFSRRLTSFYLLDSATCADGTCAAEALTGLPVWSPNGEHTLVAGKDGTIWLGDSRGATVRPVGFGTAPFWLEADTYGFVRPARDNMQSLSEVVVADMVTPNAHPWLQLETLAAAISGEIEPDRLTIKAVAVSPANADLIFLAAAARDRAHSHKSYVFAVDRQSGAITLPLVLDHGFGRYNPFGFSPDGRWLTVNSVDRHSVLWQLHLYDTDTGQAHKLTSVYPFAYPGYDWSSNSQWLLRVQDGHLHLLAPSYGTQLVIDHEQSGCGFAAWAN